MGADNGIGVAMSLALATNPNVTHGPLELLFTVEEEVGMGGNKLPKMEIIGQVHKLYNQIS